MEATRESVIQELMDEHIYDVDGNVIETIHIRSREEATALVEKHKKILDQGMRLGSYTYYIVNEILKAEDK